MFSRIAKKYFFKSSHHGDGSFMEGALLWTCLHKSIFNKKARIYEWRKDYEKDNNLTFGACDVPVSY